MIREQRLYIKYIFNDLYTRSKIKLRRAGAFVVPII